MESVERKVRSGDGAFRDHPHPLVFRTAFVRSVKVDEIRHGISPFARRCILRRPRFEPGIRAIKRRQVPINSQVPSEDFVRESE